MQGGYALDNRPLSAWFFCRVESNRCREAKQTERCSQTRLSEMNMGADCFIDRPLLAGSELSEPDSSNTWSLRQSNQAHSHHRSGRGSLFALRRWKRSRVPLVDPADNALTAYISLDLQPTVLLIQHLNQLPDSQMANDCRIYGL